MSELIKQQNITPKISVIVPVYNVEKYIHQCIDSILGQTFTDFELLLIDDGSPDNCGAICDEYAAKDSRVRVFHQENAGVSAARNKGLDEAKGEWISFIDGDDWVERDLYLVLNNAICDKLYDLIHFGVINSKHQNSYNSYVYDSAQSYVNDYMHKIYSVWHFLFKSESAKKYSFDLRFKYAEDLQFIHKYLCETSLIYVLDTPLYNYRISASSAMSSIRSESLLLQNLDVAILMFNYKSINKLNTSLNIAFASRLINWFLIFGVSSDKFDQKILVSLFRDVLFKIPPFLSKWYLVYWTYALFPYIVKFYILKKCNYQ